MLPKLGQNFGLPSLPGSSGASGDFGLPEIPSDDVPAQEHQRPHTVPVQSRQNRTPFSGSSGFESIKTLQQAIIEFANVASASDITSMKGNQEGKQEGANEYLGG